MSHKGQIPQHELLECLESVEDHEIDAVVQALTRRYQRVHPESELLFISIPKNDSRERQNIWQWLLGYLQTYEASQ